VLDRGNQSIDIPNPPKIRDKVGIQKVHSVHPSRQYRVMS
jgi:hypothetical protein